MTFRVVVVILTMLAVLCLASWLFAQDSPTTRMRLLPTPEPHPTPSPALDVDDFNTRTSDQAEILADKADQIIRVAEEWKAFLREQQKHAKPRSIEKSVTIVNKIVLPTPAPLPSQVLPEPTESLPGGLLPQLVPRLFRR